jgi:Family of unknown function (DUF6289)
MRLLKTTLVVLAICSLAAAAGALPTNTTETWYYSDDTYSEVVGYRYIGCSGGNTHWGITTQWSDFYSESCSTGAYYCTRCFQDSNGITHCDYLCSR